MQPEQAGAASGTLNTAQQFANSLGVTVVGTVFFALAGPALHSAGHAMEILDAVYVVLTVIVIALVKLADRVVN